MKRELICIICPRGCSMTAEVTDGKVIVSGNACKRGEEYAIAEMTAPKRTVTSIVRVSNREDTMVSVKTKDPIPKENIFDVMEKIRAAKVEAPVSIGDIIIDDIFGTCIIATKDVK